MRETEPPKSHLEDCEALQELERKRLELERAKKRVQELERETEALPE